MENSGIDRKIRKLIGKKTQMKSTFGEQFDFSNKEYSEYKIFKNSL